MRWVTLILVALILLLQYPLWFGKGGWLKVRDINKQVEAQKSANQKAQERNAGMDAEIRDLKQGTEAIEERARNDLGMARHNEVFFQVVEDQASAPASSPVAAKTVSQHERTTSFGLIRSLPQVSPTDHNHLH
jgi:cell division protein FtsB